MLDIKTTNFNLIHIVNLKEDNICEFVKTKIYEFLIYKNIFSRLITKNQQNKFIKILPIVIFYMEH